MLKQADVVALMALLPEDFPADVQAANFGYYEPRCGHGSSLSRGLHAVVAARLGDVDMAHRYFHATAATDLSDALAASAGGVRIAAQGALWQAAVLGIGGLTIDAEGVRLDPHLPPAWRALGFRVCWRGRRLKVGIDANAVELTLEDGTDCTVRVGTEHVRLAEPGVVARVARSN